MRGDDVGGIRRIAFFSQIFALGLVLSIGSVQAALAAAQTGADPASSAAASSGDEPPSLPQDNLFSSLKQAFNKDFDHEVVRGHFDQGSAPKGHRYYCLVDPKTGKRETNGVLGDTFPMPGGMTGIKNSSVSLYRCADAEKQGILVTAGYGAGADAGSKPVPQASAAVPVAAAPTPSPASAPPLASAPPPAATPSTAAVTPGAAAPPAVAASAAAAGGSTQGASGTENPGGCAGSTYRQFDFW